MPAIYHYTNVQGVFGILNQSNKCVNLRFTSYKCLNDATEGKELTRIFEKVCDEMRNKGELSEAQYDALKTVSFEDVNTFSYFTDENKIKTLHSYQSNSATYLCCFSKNSDSLNMWRAYSKGDIGYCIGMFQHILEKRLNYDHATNTRDETYKVAWEDVIYDDRQKEDIVRKQISKALYYMTPPLSFTLSDFTNIAKYYLSRYKFIFKHSCFSGEEEIRCILTIPSKTGLIPDKTDFAVQYRARNGEIVPYLEIDFDPNCLISVITSPTAPDSAVDTLSDYVKSFYSKRSIEISKSELPLRF